METNTVEKQETLEALLRGYVSGPRIFKNREILTIRYKPENVPHRHEQINQLGRILAPALRGERPSNVFIYGKTGTGKTLVTEHVISKLKMIARETGQKVNCLYVNCKMKRVADTEYRLLAYLSNLLGRRVPSTGLPTDQVYKTFFEALEEVEGSTIIVIDEIDALVEKMGDDILYNLTRIPQDSSINVSIIGISNNLAFIENLDPRVRSSLSDEEILFPPYNAIQLQDILNERASLAFHDGVLEEGVIPKCAALAAQEHGDARRALNLLRVAGELAEREGATRVTEAMVDMAETKIDTNHMIETIKAQPKQSKIVMLAILEELEDKDATETGGVLGTYEELCEKLGFRVLTHRRVSDLISELELLGFITGRVISRGRHGRTKMIVPTIPPPLRERIKREIKKEFFLE